MESLHCEVLVEKTEKTTRLKSLALWWDQRTKTLKNLTFFSVFSVIVAFAVITFILSVKATHVNEQNTSVCSSEICFKESAAVLLKMNHEVDP